MASNSGTGLIVGNGNRNQLYRASDAVYQPEKHGVSEIIVQKCSGIISSVPLTSTIINQQPAKNSASAMQVRRKFESTMRCRQFAMNRANDTLATHNSRISERWWLSTQSIDESRLFLRINDRFFQDCVSSSPMTFSDLFLFTLLC